MVTIPMRTYWDIVKLISKIKCNPNNGWTNKQRGYVRFYTSSISHVPIKIFVSFTYLKDKHLFRLYIMEKQGSKIEDNFITIDNIKTIDGSRKNNDSLFMVDTINLGKRIFDYFRERVLIYYPNRTGTEVVELLNHLQYEFMNQVYDVNQETNEMEGTGVGDETV